jgi:hypothetical protein
MSCGQYTWLHTLTSKITSDLTAQTKHRLMFIVWWTRRRNELGLIETTEQSFTGTAGEKHREKCSVCLLNGAKH